MRWSIFLTVVIFLCYGGTIFAAPAVELEPREANAVASLNVRENQDASSTTDSLSHETATATDTTTENHTTPTASSTTESTVSNTLPATAAATTVPSLDTSNSPGGASQNSTKAKYTGGLPIQPALTPALGVGGFILLVSGAVLAFIGIRKPW